jgi:hypothetical protein
MERFQKEAGDLRKLMTRSMEADQTIASLREENRQLRRQLNHRCAFISRLANTMRAAFTECLDNGNLILQEDVGKDTGYLDGSSCHKTEEIIRIYQDDNISAFDHGLGNVI